MRLPGVVLLFADTVRSRAYAQALLARQAIADAVMVVKSVAGNRWGQSHDIDPGTTTSADIFIPDPNIPLMDTIERLSKDITISTVGTLNHDEVTSWIESKGPALIVYSGYGGEIVKPAVLNAGAPLLHMHSGWLPDYRGSTTLYYSYLNEGSCGVSALLLEANIDTGPLVARRRYSPPPHGMEVDFVYDSAIRADLMTDVLQAWVTAGGRFTDRIDQPSGGASYYIIHPVLKHLALLDIGRRGRSDGR